MSDDRGYHYAFDGMWCNVNNIVSQEEEDARELVNQQKLYNRNKLKLKLAKQLSKYSDLELVRHHASRFILSKHQKILISRYLVRESLPLLYSEIVKQKDSIKILVEEFFSRFFSSELDLFEEMSLDILITKVQENKDMETAYVRVSEIRCFVEGVIESKAGFNELTTSDFNEGFRQFLSACRLSLLLNDYMAKDQCYQLEVNERTKQAFAYEMSRPIEHATLSNGKKYIPRWKARHLHTLEYYANATVGNSLNKLELIDSSVERIDFINNVIDICADFCDGDTYC